MLTHVASGVYVTRRLLPQLIDEMHARNSTTPMTAHAESLLKYPLVRLKVDYTG
jgi:hypothetical protein